MKKILGLILFFPFALSCERTPKISGDFSKEKSHQKEIYLLKKKIDSLQTKLNECKNWVELVEEDWKP